jgi:hypothetical protein
MAHYLFIKHLKRRCLYFESMHGEDQMKITKYGRVLTIATLFLAGNMAVAENRPNCLPTPDGPGSCFEPTLPAGAVACEGDGAVQWFPVGEYKDNQFGRQNPSYDENVAFIHTSAKEIAIGFCSWIDVLGNNCGTPGAPGEGAYIGTASFKANGLIDIFQNGLALCPFKMSGKGFASNAERGDMVEIDAVLHLVPDGNGGCKLQECRVLAPERGNSK